MPHTTRDNVSVSWRGTAADNPKPAGEESTWRAEDPAAQRYRGYQWIQGAIAALKNGVRPTQNPNQASHLSSHFDLAEGGIPYEVEVMDYSGELIKPENTGGQLSANLLDHLREFDGVFVLAEAPKPAENQVDRLGQLKQTFATLGDGAGKITSIALVVNKWDRRGPDAGRDRAAVQQFFESSEGKEYRQLVELLRARTAAGGFEIFACSAFGKSEGNSETGEVPVLTGASLPSFGLEEPFLWAARREWIRHLDAEVKKFKTSAHSPWLKFWHPFILHSAKVARQAVALRPHLLPDTQHAAQIEEAMSASRVTWLTRSVQVFLSFLLAFVVWGLLTLTADAIKRSPHKPAITGQTNESAAVDAAIVWLRNFQDRNFFWSPLSRLVLSSGDAREQLLELSARRSEVKPNDDQMEKWREELITAKDVTALLKLQNESKTLPKAEGATREQKRKFDEFRTELRQKLEENRQKENAATLEQWQSEEKTVAATAPDKIVELLSHTQKLPYPDDATEVQKKALDDFRIALFKKFHNVEMDKSYQGFLTTIADVHWTDAALLLTKFPDANKKIEAKKVFAEALLRWAKGEKDRAIQERQYPAARNKLNDIVNKSVIRENIAPDTERKLNELVQDINKAEDEYLYENFKNQQTGRTVASANEYLEKSQVKDSRWRKYVEAYKWYKEQMAIKLTITLSVHITWGKECWDGYKNKVEVRQEGNPNYNLKKEDEKSSPGVTNAIGDFAITAGLQDRVILNIEAEVTDGNFVAESRRFHGKGKITATVQELISGKEVDMNRYGNRATIQITGGVPAEPALP
ncbi:hypothetical protein [Fimbriiglobus ruber]|nr:hypothetical protein [Fimbriiglobus ruber]